MDPWRVGEVMTTDVVAVLPDTPRRSIARLLADNDIGGLPVVDGRRRVVGVVSASDVARGDPDRALCAADLMSAPPVTVRPDTAVADAARSMRTLRVGRLPVVAADGAILGVVTRGDLLGLLRPRPSSARTDAAPAAA